MIATVIIFLPSPAICNPLSPLHQKGKRSQRDQITPIPMELSPLLQALGFIIKTVWDTDRCQCCLQCWQAVKVTKRKVCAKICTLACQTYNPDANFLIGKGFNKYETISFSLCLEAIFFPTCLKKKKQHSFHTQKYHQFSAWSTQLHLINHISYFLTNLDDDHQDRL